MTAARAAIDSGCCSNIRETLHQAVRHRSVQYIVCTNVTMVKPSWTLTLNKLIF